MRPVAIILFGLYLIYHYLPHGSLESIFKFSSVFLFWNWKYGKSQDHSSSHCLVQHILKRSLTGLLVAQGLVSPPTTCKKMNHSSRSPFPPPKRTGRPSPSPHIVCGAAVIHTMCSCAKGVRTTPDVCCLKSRCEGGETICAAEVLFYCRLENVLDHSLVVLKRFKKNKEKVGKRGRGNFIQANKTNLSGVLKSSNARVGESGSDFCSQKGGGGPCWVQLMWTRAQHNFMASKILLHQRLDGIKLIIKTSSKLSVFCCYPRVKNCIK